MSVLITHARVRSALATTRSMGKHRIRVVTADSINPSTSFASRYSSASFVYPSYKLYPELFISSLKRHIEKQKINVLLPIFEETFIISKYMNNFPPEVNIPLSEYEKLISVNNKANLMNFASEIGINIPQTWKIDEISELIHIANKIEFPAVIKLVEGVGSKGLRYIFNEDELINEYKNIVRKFNLQSSKLPIIQEYIPGTGYGVSMLFNKGDPRAIFTHKRIREYPITGGPSTARVSVRNSKMEKYATKLLKELEWHGVAMVEFKLDERTKKPVLMEINPRFWGSLNLSICAGVDFPYLLYTMAQEGDVQPTFNYKTGVKSRWMLGDCRALIDYLKTDKRMAVLKDFFKFSGSDLYYDDLSFEDPLPSVIELLTPIMNYIKYGKLKFSPEESK